MKKIIRFLMCVCVCWLVPAYAFAENHTLSGQIVLQNSGGEPLAGVQVAAKGANPATSDSMGQFELKFAARKAGDRVRLTLKKEGFEVVNRKELEQVIRTDENEIVVIVMCRAGERDRHAMLYYEIAEKNIQAGYENELKKINDNYENTVKEKNAEMEKLKIQRDAALAQARDLAEKFAEVNLDEASEMYRQAFALFQSGRVEEARKVLDDAKMDQALAAAKKQKEEAEKAIQQSIENYMLKARLCIIGFQFAEAEKNFQKAVDADPENLENTFDFAYYLAEQNQHLKAVPLYEKALALAEKQKDEGKIATVLNNLGILYKDKNDYGAAEKSYLRALEIREKMALSNPDTYLPDVARTQNNLGAFYYSKNDYAAAEKSLLRALEIREKMALSNPDTYLPDVAVTQNNMGVFYKDKNDYAAAEKSFLRALEIYEKLALSNPDTYLPDVARTQNNLGAFYYSKNDYASAEKAYLRALEIREKLALSNPDTYLPYVSTIQNNLGNFYADKNDYGAAEKAYLRALEIREKLALSNPDTYLPDVAITQNNLGVLYKDKNDYGAAEKSYLRALEIREKLALSNPDTYLPDLAETQNNLGAFYHSKNDYAAAEKAYLRALEIWEKLALSNPDTYLPYVAMTQNNLGIFYKDKNDYGAAEKAWLLALEIREKLALSNPDTYLPYVAATQNNLGVFYADKNDYAAAEKAYLRALEIREKLALSNPDTYLPDVAMTLANFAIFHKKMLAEEPTEFHKEKGLEYAKRVIEISAKFSHVLRVQEYRKGAEEVKQYLETVSIEDLQTRRQAETCANKAFETEQNKGPAEEALSNYRKAVELYEKLIAKERDIQTLQTVANVYAGIVRLEKEVKTQILYQEKIIAIWEEILSQISDDNEEGKNTAKQKLAEAYGIISWNFLFDRQFAKAGEAAQKGIALDPSQEWIKTNLASSFLFTGQWEKAKAIYLELKDKTDNERKFREIFLEDLNELEKAGITHPDMAKVRELLKEP